MGGIGAEFAIFSLIVFLGGIFIGVIVVASLASRREDDLHSLTGEAPGPVCQGARWLTGAHTLGSGFVSPAKWTGRAPASRPGPGDDGGNNDEDVSPSRWPGH